MSEPRRSRLIVLAGPTAVGKGTVASEVRRHHPEVWLSVSATTRDPRPGEENGVHYWFVSDDDFDAMVEQRRPARVGQSSTRPHRYGTPRGPVELALASGHPAMLEIDLQGARQVRQTMPEALFVFLKPPSWDELVRRLVGRGTETEAERERRLETARAELAAESEFDVTIVNHEVHAAADELVALMDRPRVGPCPGLIRRRTAHSARLLHHRLLRGSHLCLPPTSPPRA